MPILISVLDLSSNNCLSSIVSRVDDFLDKGKFEYLANSQDNAMV